MKQTVLIITYLIALQVLATAQNEERRKQFNLSGKHLAIQGYDPVAYITQGIAIAGSARHAIAHKGITYYFSSPANKAAFALQPSKFEPQYGGWCAYAMGAKGDKVAVDPETFKIINGKLYLFYNKFFNNTLNAWNKDEKNLAVRADANWQKVFKEN